jgi:hypothetical protein
VLPGFHLRTISAILLKISLRYHKHFAMKLNRPLQHVPREFEALKQSESDIIVWTYVLLLFSMQSPRRQVGILSEHG